MDKIRFTIITVCLNAEEYIESTIRSVLTQKSGDYEYIIKDGGSRDKTPEIVNRLTGGMEKVRVISQRDSSIYDAMNQALSQVKGEYVFFLNAGDCFFNEEVLEKTDEFLKKHAADVVYGNILSVEGKKKQLRKYGRVSGKKIYFLIGGCICHQAMFARAGLFKDRQFQTGYQVCADREWQLYQLGKKASFAPMDFTVASVLVEGFSKNNVKRLETETRECLVKYCPKNIWIYDGIMKLKKSRAVLWLIRMLERKMFTRRYDGKSS